jgi:hypothetical protein
MVQFLFKLSMLVNFTVWNHENAKIDFRVIKILSWNFYRVSNGVSRLKSRVCVSKLTIQLFKNSHMNLFFRVSWSSRWSFETLKSIFKFSRVWTVKFVNILNLNKNWTVFNGVNNATVFNAFSMTFSTTLLMTFSTTLLMTFSTTFSM